MVKSSRSVLSVSIISALAFVGSPGYAAEKDAKETGVGTLETIVVTAQKRAQTTIDVPQSVTVVSGETLEQLHAASFSDYLKLVPGLQLVQTTPGGGTLVLRGINTGGVASTVGVYLDETPFGSSSGLVNAAILAGDFDTFDVARVEVLRGPQGSLYGASALGGVLKFVTNLPETDKVVVRARAGAASTEGGHISYLTNVLLNTPISDTLAFRVSGSNRKYGGFIDSIGTGGSDQQKDINDSRNYGGRASLLFAPNKDFSVRLSAMLQNFKANAPSVVESDPDTLATLYGSPTLSQFVPTHQDVSYRVYNGTANWGLGFANLTSSTSYSTQKQTIQRDLTVNLSPLIAAVFKTPNELYLGQNTDSKKFTQEVRLTSSQPGFIDWLVGGYYTKEDGLIRQQFIAVAPNTLTPITTLPLLALVNLSSKYKEIAAFGNATAHMNDRVDVDVGGRYSRNNQDAVQAGDGALAGGKTENKANSTENVFTYSVAPKYKFGKDAAIYARVAKGFRPGGPNVLPPNAPAGTPATYQSDTVLSYEVGAKTQSRDGVFAFDVAAFHIDWKDIQLLAVVNGFGVNTNGVSATSDGVEFSATLRPVRGLSVAVNGAYSNARLEGSTSPLVGGVKGDKLPFSPKYSLGVNSDYRWRVGDTTGAYVGGSVRHLSEQSGAFDATFRTANGRQRLLPSYNVVDLRAGLEFTKFTIEAYAKNVNNSDGKTSTSGVKANGFNIYPNGAIATGIITPRTIGLTLTLEY